MSAAGEVLPHQPGERVLGLAVERRGWLVEQPQRPFDGQEAGDGEPPPLSGRQVCGRQVGQRRQPDRGQSALNRARRRRDSGPRTTGFRRPSATASGRPGARDNGPAPGWSWSGSASASVSRPPAIRTSPAIMRRSDDLPAPFRPVTSRASPCADRKPSRREHLAAAADAGEAACLKPHRCLSRRQTALSAWYACNAVPQLSSYSRLSSRAQKKPL